MMDQIKIGRFIAQCRKEAHLTQARLAEMLDITDRAVSKWERGKSMPDASIMLRLCEILGITVNELLCGEKIDKERSGKKAEENLIALKREDEDNMAKSKVIRILFTALCATGILVCLICDLAISGALTWSLIPASSIVLAWAIVFPGIMLGKRGIVASLISVSVFIIPYLFLLSVLVKVRQVFLVGAAVAAVTVVFLWTVTAVFYRIGKKRRAAALGISFLAAIPLELMIDAISSKMIAAPAFDVWDMATVFLLLIAAFISFICDHYGKKDE